MKYTSIMNLKPTWGKEGRKSMGISDLRKRD
jgi:hypothetical protein